MPSDFELMVAPNGARLTRADHPAVPLTPAELAETARACHAAGAGAIHLHVRDAAGRHSLDPARYRAALAAIGARSDIAVQITTEAIGLFGVATQIDCIARSGAADASVALREIAREPARLPEAYQAARRAGSDVQHILYDADDLRALLRGYDEGAIPPEFDRVLFVLGRYSVGQRATPGDLAPFLAALGARPLRWSACAFGPQEQACLLAALQHGGGARIGFENNRIAPDGAVFADNAAAVASLVEAAARLGLTPRQE